MVRRDGRARDALLYILGTLTRGTVPGTNDQDAQDIYCANIGSVLLADHMFWQCA